MKCGRGSGSTNAVRAGSTSGTAQIGFADSSAVIFAKANADNIPVQAGLDHLRQAAHTMYVIEDSGHYQTEGSGRQEARRYRLQRNAEDVRRLHQGRRHRRFLGDLGGRRQRRLARHAVARPPSTASASTRSVSRCSKRRPRRRRLFSSPIPTSGSSSYGSGIVTMDSTLQSNPDMVRRFVAATLHGLKDAMANPKETGEIMHKYHREAK